MCDFDYTERGRLLDQARAEIYAAASEVVDRRDNRDPRTQRWLKAIEAFNAARANTFPEALQAVDRGEKRAFEINTADMLDYLEADPIIYRSGYMKAKLLIELKRRRLDSHEAQRLQLIILSHVQNQAYRREFFHYCRAAANVDSQQFRVALIILERSNVPSISQRANWVLAGLDGKWDDLKRAMRGEEKRGDTYVSVANPRIS